MTTYENYPRKPATPGYEPEPPPDRSWLQTELIGGKPLWRLLLDWLRRNPGPPPRSPLRCDHLRQMQCVDCLTDNTMGRPLPRQERTPPEPSHYDSIGGFTNKQADWLSVIISVGLGVILLLTGLGAAGILSW